MLPISNTRAIYYIHVSHPIYEYKIIFLMVRPTIHNLPNSSGAWTSPFADI